MKYIQFLIKCTDLNVKVAGIYFPVCFKGLNQCSTKLDILVIHPQTTGTFKHEYYSCHNLLEHMIIIHTPHTLILKRLHVQTTTVCDLVYATKPAGKFS